MDPVSFALLALALLAVGMAYHGTNTFTNQAWPAWVKDYTNREHVLAGGVVLDKTAAFARADAVLVKAAANAIIGATSITVDALTGALPDDLVLVFDGTKIAQLTAPAAAGATSITVAALAAQVDNDDEATYAGVGKQLVPAATLIGRTFAEQASGAAFGPWTTGDDEVYLTLWDVPDLAMSAEADVLRPDTLIAVNNLPNWATRPAGEIAAIRATYQTTIGQN